MLPLVKVMYFPAWAAGCGAEGSCRLSFTKRAKSGIVPALICKEDILNLRVRKLSFIPFLVALLLSDADYKGDCQKSPKGTIRGPIFM